MAKRITFEQGAIGSVITSLVIFILGISNGWFLLLTIPATILWAYIGAKRTK